MTGEKVFRSKDEELSKLLSELSEIKATIKDISSALARIERHVKRSFDIEATPKSVNPEVQHGERRKGTSEKPSITPQQALGLFDELSLNWDQSNPELVERKLQEIALPDLKLLAHELGITFSTKPSRKALLSGITGRLNERAMLSRNLNISNSLRDEIEKKREQE
jgi:hypothetical protein